jgi:hypothetical protein
MAMERMTDANSRMQPFIVVRSTLGVNSAVNYHPNLPVHLSHFFWSDSQRLNVSNYISRQLARESHRLRVRILRPRGTRLLVELKRRAMLA